MQIMHTHVLPALDHHEGRVDRLSTILVVFRDQNACRVDTADPKPDQNHQAASLQLESLTLNP